MTVAYDAALRELELEGAEFADEPPRGGHLDLSGGKSRKGIHEAADRRRKREQDAAAKRDAAQQKASRRRAEEARLRATPEGQRLMDRLGDLTNQIRHHRLRHDEDAERAAQQEIEQISRCLAELSRQAKVRG